MGQQIDHEELMSSAREARARAYAPYSKFSVGAALLTASGEIFRGCNVENISFGLTICAERTVAVAAVSAGERYFVAIAISADTSAPIVPCGACRQFLAEFSPSMHVWSAGRGDLSHWLLDELFPLPNQGILDSAK